MTKFTEIVIFSSLALAVLGVGLGLGIAEVLGALLSKIFVIAGLVLFLIFAITMMIDSGMFERSSGDARWDRY